MGYRKLTTATKAGTRLEQLKTLANVLAQDIDVAYQDESGIKVVAQLAKQYRETIAEIEELEGADGSDDEIGEILQSRADDGKPGAVRKNRSDL